MKWNCLVVMLCLAPFAMGQAIVRDGKSDYVIILATDASPANKRAAVELQSHLKQMSGVEL